MFDPHEELNAVLPAGNEPWNNGCAGVLKDTGRGATPKNTDSLGHNGHSGPKSEVCLQCSSLVKDPLALSCLFVFLVTQYFLS